MSTLIQFSNNASSLLASGCTNVATTLSLTPGTGVEFPSPGANQIFVGTIEDTLGDIEVFWCTGRSTDTLTVIRGQEGTTALAFSSGSRVELRCTAGVMGALLQKNGGDTLAGTTNLSGVLSLGGAGSIQGGEFTGYVRSAAGVTGGQISVSAGQPYSGSNLILTAGNVAASLPAGLAFAVSNMIVMWYGSSASIPAGWVLCNGANNTPNLVDQFIVGAGGTYAPVQGNTGGVANGNTGAQTITGTTDAHVLTSAEMPSHTHQFYASLAGAASGGGITIYSPTYTSPPAQYNLNQQGSVQINQSTGGGGGHSHTLTAQGSHQHTVPAPPYTGLFFIMKS